MSTSTPPVISVVGTGYLGATHAACLAELGFRVVAVDSDPGKVARLAEGSAPFSEPGIDRLLERHVASGGLRFTTSLQEAAELASVHFLCVGTPQSATSGAADLSAVEQVTRDLARALRHDSLVVGKSTVPVGTAERLGQEVARLAPAGVRAEVAWNPEFLREGHAVHDTLHPDRLVFGVSSAAAEATLRNVYTRPITDGTPVHVTDLATAELAKVAANAFLATKISFVNAMADMSERCGADIVALADVLGDDARIGRRFLDAGIGFGGGCLPKDIRALAARASDLGAFAVADLMHEVDSINTDARQRVVDLAVELCDFDLGGRRVAVLGAAFKPGSDDVRDSPALDVAQRLRRQGADVRVYDPAASMNARAVAPALTYVAGVDAALAGAELVLHLTEWPAFRELDPLLAGNLVSRRCLIDGRNALDAQRWADAGWAFHGVGRTSTLGSPRPAGTPGASWRPAEPGLLDIS